MDNRKQRYERGLPQSLSFKRKPYEWRQKPTASEVAVGS